MTHLSPQSKSFVLLLLLVLGVTYGAIQLSEYFKVDRIQTTGKAIDDASAANLLPTDDWNSYIDKAYPLVFKYPTAWKVESITTEPDYYVVSITPKNKEGEIRVYINDQDFFALKGLSSSPMRIGKVNGESFGPTLAAVKVGKYYYTFDAGLDSSVMAQFPTILSTVEFR